MLEPLTMNFDFLHDEKICSIKLSKYFSRGRQFFWANKLIVIELLYIKRDKRTDKSVKKKIYFLTLSEFITV